MIWRSTLALMFATGIALGGLGCESQGQDGQTGSESKQQKQGSKAKEQHEQQGSGSY